MIAKKIIFDPATNRYYTGRFWGTPWSLDFKDARTFFSEKEVVDLISLNDNLGDLDDEPNPESEILGSVGFLEIKTVLIR